MSNEENRTGIAAEETVDTDSSNYILKYLENSEVRQQEKLDKLAETFKSGLTGLTETLVDIFKQRNRTPGSSNEEPPAKRIRPQTSTDTRANAKCVIQKDHGVARANAIINVSDLILKIKDSGLEGVSANAYQLQLNNLITCTVDSLSILAKSCTDLNQYRRDNMKNQFQPSLLKLANNVPAGSALLFGDDLAGRIRAPNNITSLMKPTKMISNGEVFGKNPKNFQPSRRSSAYGKKGHSRQSNSFSGRYSTGQNRFQKQSRH